ncbi:hypothetical protein QWT87_13405 [Chryseobacterium sp. APV1]|uniref:Uncharacterized protein n=1 Tax=Chryseobacterium urinae TaxID=3058400 RepID=A0ABT8U493_9FLAO|nr:hypothetical protein [Chryseobacterium sp. APV1]MDO3425891.1 hypothetical protein [Chryseobacterium sp. APV1]
MKSLKEFITENLEKSTINTVQENTENLEKQVDENDNLETVVENTSKETE